MDLTLEDLRPLAGRSGRFLTLLLPAPSHLADAAERFAIERKTALKAVSTDWPADDLQALDDELAALPHDAGAGLIVVGRHTVTRSPSSSTIRSRRPCSRVGTHAWHR